MAHLEINDLCFLDKGPIHMSVDRGVCAGVSGPSGSGKTRLLRAIADLDPHSGEVLLNQVNATQIKAPDWRKQVGLLPAESRWWYDHVAPHFSTIDPENLQALGFSTDVLQWQVSRLSSGERQRLALLRLLANGPGVLLLDEPTANLDADNTAKAEQIINTYRRQRNASIIWVAHDPDQLRRVASEHYIFENGTLRPAPEPEKETAP